MAPGVSEVVTAAWDKVAVDPELLAPRLELAMIYEANNILGLAEETYEQVVERDAAQVKAWYLLGRVRVMQGKAKKAMEALAKVTELEETYVPLHWHLGHLNLELAEIDTAEREFQRAVELDPDDPSGLAGLAKVALRGRNDAAGAKTIVEELLAAHPEDANLTKLLVQVLQKLGEEERAAELTDKIGTSTVLFTKDPWGDEVLARRVRDVPTIVLEAKLALEAGDPDRALEVLWPALQKDKTNPALVAAYADVCLQTGELNSALQAVDAALKKNGEVFLLAFTKGHLLRALTQRAWPDALQWFQKATELDPTSAEAFSQVGMLQFDLNQPEEAILSAQKAEELGMVTVSHSLLIGRAKMRMSRFEEALVDFAAAMETYPEEGGPWLWTAATRTEMKMFEEAEAALAEAERWMPGHPVIPRVRQRIEELRNPPADPPADPPNEEPTPEDG